ncbi:hypothetical protein JI721_06125 [Alicyclobacillus cycloheptanicus]|uniref:Regulatory protein YycH domain-containing protein n=1 Tax=Alicyclobacillus cycloheptanicus TaxID=1457 RepID=A0ABT9XMH3_9BACL|nr:two-component system activity regulator YycH [Alicyclobacillus cycloheptanicus]MDQ0190923.1 hypothetical protein [Alicyclobacillus cycloheptanicus]WDM02374.1 hypothetical protein JI721_06125 [Alicyclobacillus cycloheptanicus]
MSMQALKSILLAALVALSVFLSFELWHGLWQSPSYASWTGPGGLPMASQPTLTNVTRPTQVVVQTSSGLSVDVPGSTGYEQALGWLKGAELADVRTASTLPAGTSASITYVFGVALTPDELAQWLPAVSRLGASHSVDQVRLYVPAGTRTVDLALPSGGSYTVGTTTLNPDALIKTAFQAVSRQPWVAWGGGGNTDLPEDSITLQREQWQTSSVSLLPLVRSFFVNPQGLTRIEENAETVLWTDGSRAVQWNGRTNTLVYADPNPVNQNTPDQGISAMISFLQSHGGTPANTIVQENELLSSVDGATNYTFRTYVNGYPVVGTAGAYALDWLDGGAAQYQRPLTNLVKQVGEASVRILPEREVAAILSQFIPKSSLSSLNVELGYAVQPDGQGQVTLEPVFEVTQNGTEVAQIDAVTGVILKGGSAS